jgi:hypothetical protein
MEQKEIKITIPEGYEIDKEQSTFEKILFKKKDNKYPKTWEECIDILNSLKTRFCYIASNSELHETYDCCKSTIDYNTLPSKEIAEKFLILQKLYTCRQAYVGNWEPDIKNYEQIKYCLVYERNTISLGTYTSTCRMFSFPTKEMGKDFIINFNNDLEKIKEFL